MTGRSGPTRGRGAPRSFWGPACQSPPQPRLRRGHSWAGSGQPARPGTSVLARVALKAGARGGGSEPAPPSQRGLPSDPRPGARHGGLEELVLSPGAQSAGARGRGFPPRLPLLGPQSDATRDSAREDSGPPAPGGGLGAPEARARAGEAAGRGGGRIPGAANRALLARAPKRRPGRWAGGGLETSQLKHRQHLGLHLGGGRCLKKKKKRIREEPQNPEAKPDPNPWLLIICGKSGQSLRPFSPKQLPPGRAAPGHPFPTSAPWRRAQAALRPCRGASLCHSAGARCPMPGARGEAGRSRRSSLNSMASVHYYTVRIFIWTAKLKTDFCQNCRSHKNDDTGWGLFL